MTKQIDRALARIIKPLLHPEFKQGFRALAHYEQGEIIDKCALGEISCQIGLPVLEGCEPTHKQILEKAGFPDWLVSGNVLPYFTQSADEGEYNIREFMASD